MPGFFVLRDLLDAYDRLAPSRRVPSRTPVREVGPRAAVQEIVSPFGSFDHVIREVAEQEIVPRSPDEPILAEHDGIIAVPAEDMVSVQTVGTLAADEEIIPGFQDVVAELPEEVAQYEVPVQLEVVPRATDHEVVAACELIVAWSAENVVPIEEHLVSRPSIHDIVPAHHAVVSGAAVGEVSGEEEVVSSSAVHDIVPALQVIVAKPAEHGGPDWPAAPRPAQNDVVASDEYVVSIAAAQKVPGRDDAPGAIVTVTGIQQVVSASQYVVAAEAHKEVPIQVVRAGSPVDDVVASLDHVVAVGPEDEVSLEGVVARSSVNHVVARAAAHDVVSIECVDDVVTAQAADDVVSRRSRDHVVVLGPHDRGRQFDEAPARPRPRAAARSRRD